jgi:hypothetical protein
MCAFHRIAASLSRREKHAMTAKVAAGDLARCRPRFPVNKPHDMPGLLEILDLGEQVNMHLLLRCPESMICGNREADKSQACPILRQ